jgi:hypothetical protein
MFNDLRGSGADAQCSGARALITLPPTQPEEKNNNTTNTTNTWLTKDHPRGALPEYWQSLIPTQYRDQVKRMFVLGDGSCAKGSLLLALQQPTHPDYTHARYVHPPPRSASSPSSFISQLTTTRSLPTLPNRPPLVHAPKSIQEYFTEILSTVHEWDEEQWCAILPIEMRDDIWDTRPRCTGPPECARDCTCPYRDSARTPELELTLFREAIDRPTKHQGPAFFFVVTRILGIGLLLISQDEGFAGDHQLHDFGTKEYPSSMVVYHSSHGRTGTGHYETVGLFPIVNGIIDEMTPEVFTLFAPNHWLLTSLRSAVDRYTGPDVSMADHLEVLQLTGLTPVIPQPSTDPMPPPAPSPSTDTRAYARPQRNRRPPARFREEEGDQPSTQPSTTRRSLEQQLNESITTSSVNGPKRRTQSAAAAIQPHSPPPVEAAPRGPRFEPPATIGDRLLANTQDWTRTNMLKRGRMASRVHSTAVPSWTNQCRTAFQQLAVALQKSPMNEREVIGYVCVLWLLPAAVFCTPGRSRGGVQGRQSRHNRIHHALRDRELIAQLFASVTQSTVLDDNAEVQQEYATALQSANIVPENNLSDPSDSLEDDSPTNADANTESDDVRIARKAESHFRAGHIQRALHCLASTSVKADTQLQEEREILHDLHPSCPSQLPPCPLDAPEVVVDLEWMAAEMHASDTGAAPGPSGWGSNMLRVLATDTHCVTALALIVQFIVNDAMPPVVRTLLTTTSLISLVKDDKGGRRPVAVGEMLYRLAARYALFRVLGPAQRALRPHQFGVGSQDGCTQVVQSLQHLLTLPPKPVQPPSESTAAPSRSRSTRSQPAPAPPVNDTPRPLACLSIDMSNAFNAINRAALLKAVYSNHELEPCWRMLSFAYGHEGLLMMKCDEKVSNWAAFITSDNGVRQGDPLSALLFSMGMHSVYSHIAKQLQSGCYAYIDDGHGVGLLSECWKVWQALPQLLEPLGLKLNTAKCELTCFHTSTLQHKDDIAALDEFTKANVKFNDSSLKVLGCVVGKDDDTIAQVLRTSPKFSADQRVAFERLPLLKKQTRNIALRYLNGTILNNRLRAMPPAATAEHATEYDGHVLKAAHRLVGVSPMHGDQYDTQLRWPLRVGGFGFTSALEIAPAAYLAGLTCTLSSSPAFHTQWTRCTQPPTPSCSYHTFEPYHHPASFSPPSLIASLNYHTLRG